MANMVTMYSAGKRVSYRKLWMLGVLEHLAVRLRRRLSRRLTNAPFRIRLMNLLKAVSISYADGLGLMANTCVGIKTLPGMAM